jgi:hypothetical protein
MGMCAKREGGGKVRKSVCVCACVKKSCADICGFVVVVLGFILCGGLIFEVLKMFF